MSGPFAPLFLDAELLGQFFKVGFLMVVGLILWVALALK